MIIKIDPALGDAIVQHLEEENGVDCHIVLIAIPLEGDTLGQPSFCTSLAPDDMETVLAQIAEQLPAIRHSRIIQGGPA